MQKGLRPELSASKEDNGKVLYSQIRDIGKQLDTSISTSRYLQDLFSPEAIALRRRLRDKCEKLLQIPGCVYRRKTEDLLWQKAFYDVLTKCRGARKHWSSGDGVGQGYQRHLATTIAFYKDLIRKLEEKYSMTFTGTQPTDLDPDDDNGQWLKTACYRSLVHMGDAARYQFELVPTGPSPITFYHSAIALDPTNGTAFNQLAALAGDKNEYCDAAYYYWRSLSSPEPFKGAEENLKKVFDKIKSQYKLLSGPKALSVQENAVKQFVCKRLLVTFLTLQIMLTSSDQSVPSSSDIGTMCQQIIEDLEECFGFDLQSYKECPLGSDTPPDQVPLLLPCELVLKLSCTAILTAHSLRIKGSTNTPAATALALAVCSQLMDYMVQRLGRTLQHRVLLRLKERSTFDVDHSSIPSPTPQQPMMEYLTTGEVGKLLGFKGEDPVIKMKRRKSRLKAVDRQRRRRKPGVRRKADLSESEDNSGSESTGNTVSSDSISDFEDLGEDEVQLLENLSSSDESGGEGPVDHDPTSSPRGPVGRGKRQNIVLAMSFSNPQSKPPEKAPPPPVADFTQVCQFACEVLAEEKFLMVVKVFGDWLQATPVVIATCTQSASSLWSRLAELLNFLPSESQLVECGYATPLELTHPPALTEDEVLRGFAPLVMTQEHLNYSSSTMSPPLQAANRVFYIHGFGQFVANAKTAPLFNFDKMSQRYIGPAQEQQKGVELAAEEEQRKEKEIKEKQSKLMKAMAKHRLETEVADLSKQKESQPVLVTPFLLPDASTLCNNLHIIKKLMKTERFVIVIAKSVLDMLDQMKKDKSNFSARDAIKFLEKAFQQRNKFLRPQAAEETADPEAKRAHKQDLQIWLFQSLVNCAVYFTRESLKVSLGTCPATLLLDSTNIESDKLEELIEHARSHAVDIDTPLSFYRHWNKTT